MAIRVPGYGLYEGSSVLQNGVANTEIRRNVTTGQFGGGINVPIQLKLLFPIGFRGEFGPSQFRRSGPALRTA
jgi:hypothetical protein